MTAPDCAHDRTCPGPEGPECVDCEAALPDPARRRQLLAEARRRLRPTEDAR